MRIRILVYILLSSQISKAQSYIWAHNLPGQPWASECKELAVDDEKNVFVTGLIEDSVDFDPGAAEYWLYSAEPSPFIAKYSADGGFIWAKVFPCTFWGLGEDAEVDEQGNVYVLGQYSEEIDFQPGNTVPYGGAFLMKLSPGGSIIWNNIFKRRYGLDATALTYRKGKLYIGGQLLYGVDLDPGPDSAVFYNSWVGLYFAAYDTTGKYLWGKNINSSGNLSSIYDMETDVNGNIVMTGYFNEYADFDPGPGIKNLTASPPYMELFLAKYDSLGNFIWAEDIPVKTAYGTMEGPQLEIMPSGNIALAGSFSDKVDFDPGPDSLVLYSNPGDYSAFFGIFKNDGKVKWVKSLYGGFSSATGLAVDDRENIYVSGDAVGTNDFDPGPGSELVTMDPIAGIYFARYDSTGSYDWARVTGNWIGGTVTNPTFHQKDGYQYLCGYFRREADLDPGPDSAFLRSKNASGFFAKYSATGATVRSTCLGDPVIMALSDPSFVDSLEWRFTDGGKPYISTQNPTTHIFQTTGTKEIQLVWYRRGESFTEKFTVEVSEPPRVDLGEPIYLCGSYQPVLSAETPGAEYLWQDGSTGSTLQVMRPGLYWVRVSLNGCVSMDSVEVSRAEANVLQMPNIITPNGDGINDYFLPIEESLLNEMALQVYSRWGSLVYENSHYTGEWDASSLASGVYYYILKSKTGNCDIEQKGSFHIQKD